MTSLVIPRRSRRSALPALGEPLDRLFADLWRGFDLPAFVPEPGFAPRVDVHESEKELVVTAELPGLDEKDFEVSLEADVLTLSGEKRVEHEQRSESIRHVERATGRFERRVALPAGVDPKQVRARFRNGVLTVTVTRPAQTARNVPIGR